MNGVTHQFEIVIDLMLLELAIQDGKAKRQDMTAASAVGDEDAPEHLFLRFYIVLTSNYEAQPGLVELERDGEGNEGNEEP